MSKRLFLGHKIGSPIGFLDLLWSDSPTSDNHPEYSYLIGPFRTKSGAVFMKKYGNNNPHCCSVYQAEKLAKKYA